MRIFSGIRPSGKLHLGNYLGAIKNWIELQNHPDLEQAVYAVVDYHGITTPFDPKIYHQQVMDTVLDYLAAGLDPKKVILMRQSHVSAHTELAWIFNTITSVSWLDRLPTYREQLEKNPKYNHVGLLDYPVLMASDILLYKSNLVPVGEDQLPHIDVTNEIAKKFNHLFGETFPAIKPHLEEGLRIMSLQDPAKKMSKTGDEGIALSDDPDTVRAKIKKAVTDSGKEIYYHPENKPAISNLIMIYHLLYGKSHGEDKDIYNGKSYAEFKNILAEVIIDFLKPFQQKRNELSKDMDKIEDLLRDHEEKASAIANKTLKEVKQKMGLI
ncbi:MAG: tryptophan--tRNA ligase [Parcubacteria group bacterium]|nr:tryptophan--tRNA ligase [Parcubacteria group bacterium]